MKQSSKKRSGAQRPTTHMRTDHDGGPIPLLHAAKALAICIGVSLLLLLAASLIAYFSADPDRLVLPLGLGVAALTAFLGGYTTLRLHHKSALMCGLTFAILFTLLSLPLGIPLASRGVAYRLWVVCLLRTSIFVLSVAGAFCALRRMERAPKRKRRKHA